jgi:glutamyl-tRNA(Gln) amidotransferase subunit D
VPLLIRNVPPTLPEGPQSPMAGANADDPWERLRALPMGQRIELIEPDGHTWTGTVVPRHEFSGERILPLKLESGYNVGVRILVGTRFRLIDAAAPRSVMPAPHGRSDPPQAPASGARVVLLTTGGTIASRVDYETGGVRPVRDEREILSFYPDLSAAGPVRIVPVLDRLSEDIVPGDWMLLADHVASAFRDGASGVVIAHGTDTLAFTSAALSFLLADLPGPVVVVGAQRSPDRPSSDGPSNLGAAVRVAREGRFGEVVVVMHGGLSDERFAIHRGTSVRKMHASRRDAFESRNGPPLGFLDAPGIEWTSAPRPAATGPARVDGPIDERGGLLWFYPGLTPERAASFAQGLRGLVLAGTGLGHVANVHLPWIRDATRRGVVVAMTTQCLAGNVDPYVYATGRELQQAGVLYLGDLLPETAYAKLLWALGHGPDAAAVRALLLADVAGEFHWRHLAGADR